MRDVLQAVDDTVLHVIGWVEAPFISSVWMWLELDTIRYGIAHAWVRVLHVDLHPHAGLLLVEVSFAHQFEQPEILFNRGIAVGAVFLLLTLGLDVFLWLEVNVALSSPDKLLSKVKHVLEVF